MGLIKFKTIGGMNINALINQRVVIDNRVSGVILGVSPHLEQTIELSDLVIDCGYDDYHQACAQISIGDSISFANQFVQLANNKVAAKALDNRVGVMINILMAQYLVQHKASLEQDVYLLFSVQEEVGLRGAKTILNTFNQELEQIIVVDVSPVTDYIANTPSAKLGAGFLIRIKDPYMVFNYQLINQARTICAQHQIKYQPYFSQGGTDASNLELNKCGNKVLALCIAGRNLHSNHSIIDLDDIKSLLTFLAIYLTKEEYEKED